MTAFLQLNLAIVIIIIVAKLGGYVSLKLKQPSVLGELIAGIIIGPTVIDIFHMPYFSDPHLTETIHQLAELGVLLLMFIAGLDLHITELAKTGKISASAGLLGVVLPIGMGVGVGLLFSMGWLEAFFLGLILSATSVSISAQTLMELKVLRSRVGVAMLGAAVFDDILVVLGLSVFVALTQAGGGGFELVLTMFLRMLAYLFVAVALGIWLLPRLSVKIDRLPVSRGLIAFAFVVILLYGWAAETLGSMAAITGAFLAGLMLSRSPVKERIESGIATIAYSVFVPIFFVNVGLSANGRDMTIEYLWFALALILVAIISKLFGSGLGAYIAGLSRQESLQLGAAMMSRGEVGLIVASVGIVEGWLNKDAFTAVIGVVIITTLITPISLRLLFATKTELNPRLDVEKGGGDE